MPAKGKVACPFEPPEAKFRMEVYINNEIRQVSSSTLQGILQEQSLSEKKGIAVAVNGTVIPRSAWKDLSVQSNDRLTIIRATQGG